MNKRGQIGDIININKTKNKIDFLFVFGIVVVFSLIFGVFISYFVFKKSINFSVNITKVIENKTTITISSNKTANQTQTPAWRNSRGDGSYHESSSSLACTNDLSCIIAGIFCDGNISYYCSLDTDGCLKKTVETNCSLLVNGICVSGIGCVQLNECSVDSNCSNLNNVCGYGVCNLTSAKCEVRFNSSTTVCRDSAEECDITDFCSGSSAACPANSFNSSGTICSIGECDGSGSCICVPTKTCADYPGQCRIDLDDGCGEFLDCADNCNPGEIGVMKDNFEDNSLDTNWTKDMSLIQGTEINEVNGEIEIYAKPNSFAHIERANTEDNITVISRIKISDINSGSSWSPGLILYWSEGNWTSVQLDGNTKKFLVLNIINGSSSAKSYDTLLYENYYWVAIQLTPSLIKTYKSNDGVIWTLLYERSRSIYLSGAPLKIILGKGYGTGSGLYSNPDLDNDFSNPNSFSFSYSYIDDFRVIKKEELNQVSLRSFPYPYKAGLSIVSDIDGTSLEELYQIHQFLNTKENTSENVFNKTSTDMGPGVGLEIGDSFWMYTRNDADRGAGYKDSFSYFSNNTNILSDTANIIRTYVHAGYLDSMHSFGDFSVVGGFTRQIGIDALLEIRRAEIMPTVWISHGDEHNNQNIGNTGPDNYMRGDLPGSAEYHTDKSLFPEGPFRFAWSWFGGSSIIGTDRLVTKTLSDSKKVHAFTRFAGLNGWNRDALKYQLSEASLDTLMFNKGYAIMINHLGSSSTREYIFPVFDTETIDALRDLANRQERGDIYVTTGSKILWYKFVHDNLNFSYRGNCTSGIVIDIINVKDDAFGNFIPTIEELQGITFYTDCLLNTSVFLNGTDIINQMQINPPDYRGFRSISFPLIKLPPLPEWISDGYTKKTEYYNINDYNYDFTVTNIDNTPYIPTLKYIGLHAFEIKDVMVGPIHYIYIPDNKTISLSILQLNEILEDIRVLNGPYDISIPRITNNSNSAIEIFSASYDESTKKVFLVLNGSESTTLTLQNFNSPFIIGNSIINSNNIQYLSLIINNQLTTVNSTNMILIPSESFVNVSVDTWDNSQNYYKKWVELSDKDISVDHVVGDLKANTYYNLKVNGEIYNNYLSDSSGIIRFVYPCNNFGNVFEIEENLDLGQMANVKGESGRFNLFKIVADFFEKLFSKVVSLFQR